MCKTFRLKPEAFRKRTLRPMILRAGMLLLAGAVGLTIEISSFGPPPTNNLVVILLLFISALAYGFWRSVRREREAWNSYELVFSDNEIRRKMAFRSDVVLSRDSITKATINSHGDIAIQGNGRLQAIGVPSDLDGISDFRAMLSTWRSIETRSSSILNWSPLGGLLATGGLAATFMANSPWIVVPVGILTAAGLLFSLLFLWFIPQHVDRRVRRWLWVGILPVVWIILRVLQVLH